MEITAITMHRKSTICLFYHSHNHKLQISTAPTKAKLQEPAYSQASFTQNHISRSLSIGLQYLQKCCITFWDQNICFGLVYFCKTIHAFFLYSSLCVVG